MTALDAMRAAQSAKTSCCLFSAPPTLRDDWGGSEALVQRATGGKQSERLVGGARRILGQHARLTQLFCLVSSNSSCMLNLAFVTSNHLKQEKISLT